jgi:hypothetical protein
LRQVVGEAFITAAEHAAFENAEKNYAGIFASPDLPDTNVTITVDDDKAGLGIESMFFNGTESRGELAALGAAGIIPATNFSVRIYPVGIESTEGDTTHYGFRGIPVRLPNTRTRAGVEGGVGMFENSCLNWLSVDFQSGMGGYGTDEFVLKVVAGHLESVSYRASNVTMERVNAT